MVKGKSSSAVMSTGSFVLASLIMCIPVVGLIFCIVWACGKCSNLNKRNYARAVLIFMAVGIACAFLLNNRIGAVLGGGIQGLFHW